MIYKIFDTKTKSQIGKDYTRKNRKRAYNRIDKLNLNYGSYRYYVKTLFNEGGINDKNL